MLDWYSRYVLSWQLSKTMEVACCLTALEQALAQGRPEVFNTDPGAQLTSLACTTRLAAAHVAISRDGRGRVFDHIVVERFWRTVKYEDMYLKDYESVLEMTQGGRHTAGSIITSGSITRWMTVRQQRSTSITSRGKKLTDADRIVALTMGSTI